MPSVLPVWRQESVLADELGTVDLDRDGGGCDGVKRGNVRPGRRVDGAVREADVRDKAVLLLRGDADCGRTQRIDDSMADVGEEHVKRGNGDGSEHDAFAIDGGGLKDQLERFPLRQPGADSSGHIVEIYLGNFVGESDRLKREMKPPAWNKVETRQFGKYRLIVSDQPVQCGGIFECEMPGVYEASGSPASTRPPVIAQSRCVFGVHPQITDPQVLSSDSAWIS